MDFTNYYIENHKKKVIKKIIKKVGIAAAVWYFPIAGPTVLFAASALQLYSEYTTI